MTAIAVSFMSPAATYAAAGCCRRNGAALDQGDASTADV
jgi:hypothetical protein